MKPEQQRIALAKLDVTPDYLCSCGLHWRQSDKVSCGNSVDDYPNNLNALHGIITRLSDDDYGHYLRHLLDAVFRANGTCRRWHEATASQKSESVLRAIGKWKEDQDEN